MDPYYSHRNHYFHHPQEQQPPSPRVPRYPYYHHQYQHQQEQTQLPPLTPYEQTLAEEVIYLHSLWHQGPPPPRNLPTSLPDTFPPPPIPNPIIPSFQYRNNYPPPRRTLHAVTNPTRFKKKTTITVALPETLPDPGPEWPVLPPPRETNGWPVLQPKEARSGEPVSDVVREAMAAKQMQKEAMERCRKFFKRKKGGTETGDRADEEEEESVSEEEEECSSDDDKEEEEKIKAVEDSEEFKFFLNLFVENRELRELYEENKEGGDVYCLVCWGIGKKVWRHFNGCVSLYQHSQGINKTLRRRAHRAFARVVSMVVGLNIDALPMIMWTGVPLGRTTANSGQTPVGKDDRNAGEGNAGTDDGGADHSLVGGKASDGAENRRESVVSEEFSKEVDGKTLSKDPDNAVLPTGDSKEGNLDHANQSESSHAVDAHNPDEEHSVAEQAGGPLVFRTNLKEDDAGTWVVHSIPGESSAVTVQEAGVNQQ